MAEAGRNIELALVLAGEGQALPPAKGRGTAAQIDRDVKHFAIENRDQLALRGRVLKVQPAQRAAPRDLADAPPTPHPEVLGAVAALSPRQRAVVYLTYWEDLDPGSAAALLGISDGAVRRHLARARKTLRGVLDA